MRKPIDVVREGEKPRTWYRTDRVFRNRHGWYFQTREGIDVGPFGCRFDAEVDLEALVRRLEHLENETPAHAIHVQAVNASSGDYILSTPSYTNYVVEDDDQGVA